MKEDTTRETPVVPEILIARSRLIPPRVQRDWIPRQDLLQRLSQADHVPVTLVVAPAGSGKSGLLAQWASSRREPVAWLTLDERDSSLAAFSTMLAHAINEVEPQTIFAPLRYLELAADAADPQTVATHFLNDLADLTADLTIVLDDAHVITDPTANAVIQALAMASLPGLRLVISSRSDPPWPLATLRASGRLLEFRPADLRLSLAEVTEYVTRAGRDRVPPEVGHAIWTSSAGWLTGVRFLCAGPRRAQPADDRSQFIDPARSDEAMGRLLNEALSGYPPLARDLLSRLAIPNRVNRSLAEALSAGLCSPQESRATYDALVEDGLFLAGTADDGWSIIHAHVRQILLTRLTEQEGTASVRCLHGQARDWFIERRQFDEAIHHARAAGGSPAVADVLRVATEPALAAEEWRTVERWLGQLPQEIIAQDPDLLIAAAWAVRLRGDLPRSQALAEDAARLVETDAQLSEQRRQELAAEVSAIEASIVYMLGDAQRARSLADAAIAQLPPGKDYALAQAHLTRALSDFRLDPAGAAERVASAIAGAAVLPPRAHLQLWSALGFITYQQGDLRRTLHVAAQMRALAAARGSAGVVGWGDALAALASYELNDLDAAVAHATAVLQRTSGVHRVAMRESLYILAMSYEAKQQFEDADLTLERLAEFILTENAVRNLIEVEGLRAAFALRRGDDATARAWFERAVLPEPVHPTHAMVDARVAHLSIAVSLGIDLEPALERITGILEAGVMYDTLLRRVELMVLLAIGRHRLGDVPGARSVLSQAISLGQPVGLTRVFLDHGGAILPVLDDAIAYGIPLVEDATRLRDLAAAEVAAVRTRRRRVVAVPRENRAAMAKPLTERELEVLALVGQRLTNKEIGALLHISPLTVKRHTINIYAKLGVRTRRQAIERATRTGLLGDDAVAGSITSRA